MSVPKTGQKVLEGQSFPDGGSGLHFVCKLDPNGSREIKRWNCSENAADSVDLYYCGNLKQFPQHVRRAITEDTPTFLPYPDTNELGYSFEAPNPAYEFFQKRKHLARVLHQFHSHPLYTPSKLKDTSLRRIQNEGAGETEWERSGNMTQWVREHGGYLWSQLHELATVEHEDYPTHTKWFILLEAIDQFLTALDRPTHLEALHDYHDQNVWGAWLLKGSFFLPNFTVAPYTTREIKPAGTIHELTSPVLIDNYNQAIRFHRVGTTNERWTFCLDEIASYYSPISDAPQIPLFDGEYAGSKCRAAVHWRREYDLLQKEVQSQEIIYAFRCFAVMNLLAELRDINYENQDSKARVKMAANRITAGAFVAHTNTFTSVWSLEDKTSPWIKGYLNYSPQLSSLSTDNFKYIAESLSLSEGDDRITDVVVIAEEEIDRSNGLPRREGPWTMPLTKQGELAAHGEGVPAMEHWMNLIDSILGDKVE